MHNFIKKLTKDISHAVMQFCGFAVMSGRSADPDCKRQGGFAVPYHSTLYAHLYGFYLRQVVGFSAHSSFLIPHSSSLIPHSSSLIPHSSSLIPHPEPRTN